MKTKVILLTISILISISFSEEIPNLKALFDKSNSIGSIVIKKIGERTVLTNDSVKANERFKPASTFKLLNTLIAIDGKYITLQDTIRWDKKEREIEQWNQDQTITTAFKYSCVWAYESIQKKIGIKNYPKYLEMTKYGNMLAGEKDTSFWLYGGLRISTSEQVEFIEGIYREKYPFDKKTYEILKDLMIDSKTENYTIYGKTGWVDDIGWYVGFVETKNGVWIFATILEDVSAKNGRLKLRKELTTKALTELKIL